MPTLLHGTLATIDATIAAASYKCHMSSMSFAFERRDQVVPPTFCGNLWEQAINSYKSIRGVMSGFLAKGDAQSKFGQFFLTDTYPLVSGVFDTGCSISFTAVMLGDTAGTGAGTPSSRVIAFRNATDDVTIAWVVSSS